MNPQPHFRPDLEVGQLDEHVERVGHPAVGRVLQRHQAKLDVAAIDFLENGRDRAHGDMLDGLAKLGDRGEMAVTVLRSQAGNLERSLQRSRAAHQLAEDGAEGFGRERALAGRQRLGDHLVFARGRPDLHPLIVFELDDLRRDLRAAIQESDEVLIQPIDLAPQAPHGGMPLRVARFRGGSPIFRAAGWLIAMGRLPGHGSTQRETLGTVATRIFNRQRDSRSAPISAREDPHDR